MSRTEAARDAIQAVAQDMRAHAEKNGVQMTQTEAHDRVVKARDRGDLIRENGNR